MSERQVVTGLVSALEQCLHELVTLKARLPEPYRSNVAEAAKAAEQALKEYKEYKG